MRDVVDDDWFLVKVEDGTILSGPHADTREARSVVEAVSARARTPSDRVTPVCGAEIRELRDRGSTVEWGRWVVCGSTGTTPPTVHLDLSCSHLKSDRLRAVGTGEATQPCPRCHPDGDGTRGGSSRRCSGCGAALSHSEEFDECLHCRDVVAVTDGGEPHSEETDG